MVHRENVVHRNISESIQLIKGLKHESITHMSSQNGNQTTTVRTTHEYRFAVKTWMKQMREKPALMIKSCAC